MSDEPTYEAVLKALVELAGKATAEPWTYGCDWAGFGSIVSCGAEVERVYGGPLQGRVFEDVPLKEQDANAQFIAAARNAIPAMSALLKAIDDAGHEAHDHDDLPLVERITKIRQERNVASDRVSTLLKEREAMRKALKSVGVPDGDGYFCWCVPADFPMPNGEEHHPRCRAARAALEVPHAE